MDLHTSAHFLGVILPLLGKLVRPGHLFLSSTIPRPDG